MQEYKHFSGRAGLVTVGLWMQTAGIWEVVRETVHIQQKTLRHSPSEKLLDALVNILAGGQGIVEINRRVRPDIVLQRAFGRSDCAEQSTVSQTLEACTADNVEQMRQALQEVYRRHSQGYRHDYAQQWQLLDVDMSGLPTDCVGEGVTRGYFGPNRAHRGRQVGRVCASWYDEIVVERLYTGRVQLHHGLRELIRAAEQVLELSPARRQRTLIRLDSGGGEDAHVNWLLQRGYIILVKAHSSRRAQKLAATVQDWTTDPADPARQMAFLVQGHAYARPTQQVVVRFRKQNGRWAYALLVCNAPHALLCQLGHYSVHREPSERDRLLAMVYAYDRRGGGIESQFKGDKRGLFIAQRRKRAFAAQEMLLLLAVLAHHLLVWLRSRLAQVYPPLAHFGVLRLVRDVFAVAGLAYCDAQGHLLGVMLNWRVPLAKALVQAFAALCDQHGLSLALGEI